MAEGRVRFTCGQPLKPYTIPRTKNEIIYECEDKLEHLVEET